MSKYEDMSDHHSKCKFFFSPSKVNTTNGQYSSHKKLMSLNIRLLLCLLSLRIWN